MYSIEDKIRSRFFIWCGVRIIALILMIIYLVLLCKNFSIMILIEGTIANGVNISIVYPLKVGVILVKLV